MEILNKKRKRLKFRNKRKELLTDLGEEVHKYLQEHFDSIITPLFTANIESELDLIAQVK